jgi:hypothetical protein
MASTRLEAMNDEEFIQAVDRKVQTLFGGMDLNDPRIRDLAVQLALADDEFTVASYSDMFPNDE